MVWVLLGVVAWCVLELTALAALVGWHYWRERRLERRRARLEALWLLPQRQERAAQAALRRGSSDVTRSTPMSQQ